MRIILFTNEIKIGGSELVAILEAEGLVRQNIDVRLIAAKGGQNPTLEAKYSLEDRIAYCDFPKLRLKNIKKIIEKFKYLVSEVDNFQPDFIHSHGEVPDIIAIFLRLSVKGHKSIKFLRTVHNERFLSLKYGFVIERFLNIFFDHVITISNRTNYLNGSRNNTLIYNPIRIDVSSPNSTNCIELKKFGIIGRLTNQKNQIQFLKELAEYCGPNWQKKILLFGFATSEFPMSEIPPYFHKNIEVRGFEVNLSKLYDDLDAVIIPSKYEGLSTVMVEALSRNKFVLTKNVSGASDLGAVSKKLITFSTISDFCQKIEALHLLEDTSEQLLLSDMFEPRKHVDRLLRLYKKL